MLEKINRSAAGIDVGSEKLYVGIPQQKVRSFDTFTNSLHQLRDYLKAHQITTVAMEATGVYWWPIYRVLEQAGLEVFVVNGAHVKNVPGRKTDVADCQWLAQLHSQGLLASGFVPPQEIRKLRHYTRLRQDHVRSAAQHILHMQKALDLMNIKIHDVFSDTTGVSSLRMIRLMIAGVRDPQGLLAVCDNSVLARKEQQLLKALEGTWDEEQIFALKQAVAAWDFYQQQILQCDSQINHLLQTMAATKPELSEQKKPTKKKLRPNAPVIQGLSQTLQRITGADLTALPCITDYTQMLILAEIGTDMSRWPSAQHFVSWLGLSPGKRDSGKRRRNQKRFRGTAGKIFCVAARSLARSKHLALAGFYRRLRSSRGGQVANIAAARKIAILFYNALRFGLTYVEEGLAAYEKKYKQQTQQRLLKAARRFGLLLTQQPVAP